MKTVPLSKHFLLPYDVELRFNDDKNWCSNQRKIASIIASVRIILLPTVRLNKLYVPLFKQYFLFCFTGLPLDNRLKTSHEIIFEHRCRWYDHK